MNLSDPQRESLKHLPYRDFLQTEFWAAVRTAVYERAHRRCELCFSAAHLNAHHKTYEWHGFEDLHLETLICLCSGCHGKFHDKLSQAKQQDRPTRGFQPLPREFQTARTLPGGAFGSYLRAFDAIGRPVSNDELKWATRKWAQVSADVRLESLLHILHASSRGLKLHYHYSSPSEHLGRHKYRLLAAKLLDFLRELESFGCPLENTPKLFLLCTEKFRPLGYNRAHVALAAQELEGEFIHRINPNKFIFRLLR